MVQQKVKYTDTERTPAERARALLEEMTLDEKMAQLGCIFPFGDSYDDMEQQALEMPYGIGQVSTLEMRRIGTLEEAAGWQRKMQETVMRQSPHHIPAIFHMEDCAEHLFRKEPVSPPESPEAQDGIRSWKRR